MMHITHLIAKEPKRIIGTICLLFLAQLVFSEGFTIVASSDSNGGISPTGNQHVDAGNDQTFTFIPNSGYHIADVRVDGASDLKNVAGNEYTFYNVTDNHTIDVSFTNQYNITTDVSPASSGVVSGAGNYNEGENANITATANSGYHFVSWTDGGSFTSTDNPLIYNVTSDATLTAIFSANPVITSSAGSNGEISPLGTTTVVYGTDKTYAINPAPGYHIADVKVDNVSVGAVSSYQFTSVIADHSIEASFDPNKYTVTFRTDGTTEATLTGNTSQLVDYNTNCTPVTAVASSGYRFVNWTDGGSFTSIDNPLIYNVTSDATLTATFSANPVITSSAGSNGEISPLGTTTVVYGTDKTYAINPATGYHITDVKVDNVSVGAVSSYQFTSVIADHSIEASFDPNKYTVTFRTDGTTEATLTGNTSQMVDYNTNCTPVTAVAPAGYHFVNWSDGASFTSIDNPLIYNVTSDATLTATFSANPVITSSAGSNGEISPLGTTTVVYGTDKTYAINPAPGYHIADVKVDNVSVGAVSSYQFTSVIADHSIEASFAPNKYTVTFHTDGTTGATLTGNTSQMVDYNTNCTAVTAVAPAGYRFVNWTDGGSFTSTNNPLTYSNVITNATVTATFALNPVLTMSSGLNGSVTPSGNVSVNRGSSQSFTITPSANYRIADILLDGVSDMAHLSGNTYTISNVTTNHTIQVSFFNYVPIASAVFVSGETYICKKLSGHYTYSDQEGDHEQGSVYKWYRASTLDIADTVRIAGAVDSSYVLTRADYGKYIYFQVTPKASTGASAGAPVLSGATKIISSDVHIVGLNTAYSLAAAPVPLQGTPAGGTFSGDGVVPASNLFYPNLAGVNPSPHPIVYSYTSPTTGCSNTDTVKVKVIDAVAFIDGIREGSKYCNYDQPFTITGGNSGTIGSFTISGGVGLTNIGNNKAIIDPSQLQSGNDTIRYTYFNNVYLTISKTITIEQLQPLSIQGVSTSPYCSNNARLQLSVSSPVYAIGVFSGNGVAKNSNNTYYFDPAIATPGKATVKFLYSTPGCNISDSIVTRVVQAPTARFEIQNNCWRNDSTAFINLSEPKSSINSWEWNFGDNAAPASKNISNKFEQKHLYPSNGDYTVSLIARSTNGCASTQQKSVHLGDVPVANFDVKNECFDAGIPITLKSHITGNDSISFYNWVVQDAPNVTFQYNKKDIQHAFPAMNSYVVKLVAGTASGCKDSITRTINLRPVYSLKDSSYFNNFEKSNGYWYPEPSSVNNWAWATPSGASINTAYSGSKAMYTSFSSSRRTEQMIVTSPCFNFSDVSKPYFQSWINKKTVTGLEGAMLQFEVDTVGQWTTIGTVGSGINWYDDNNISANPAEQKAGWSGNSTGWIQARNSLDAIGEKNLVRFRMVYGSSAFSAANDGFAFDDVFIGQRTKTVLLEQFTNTSATGDIQANSIVDDVLSSSGSDAVGIQYHTSFPGADTLKIKESPDPTGARVLYYSLGNVPQCFLDGGSESKYVYDFNLRTPTVNDVRARALKDADFSISITRDNSNSQTIAGTVTVKALHDIAYSEVSVYIAIVEDIKAQSGTTIINYNNVLKKLMPNAAGLALNKSWTQNAETTVPYSWTINNVYNNNRLKVIAFIQDNQTREVYQATVNNTGFAVGIPDIINPELGTVGAVVYPNPAKDVAKILFDKELPAGYELQILDQWGRTLKHMKILPGVALIDIEVHDLPSGLYFVQIINKAGLFKTLKLVIE